MFSDDAGRSGPVEDMQELPDHIEPGPSRMVETTSEDEQELTGQVSVIGMAIQDNILTSDQAVNKRGSPLVRITFGHWFLWSDW